MKLIPEKTMEQWLATGFERRFGPKVWLWSPTSRWDQAVAPGDFDDYLKVVLFELKTPEDSGAVKIDIDQLGRYVDAFQAGDHPDVIYVVADPPWTVPPIGTMPIEAQPVNRLGVLDWCYCIRASVLRTHFRFAPPPFTASVRVDHGVFQHSGYPIATGTTLAAWLTDLRECTEPVGTAWRNADTVKGEDAARYEPWILGPDRQPRMPSFEAGDELRTRSRLICLGIPAPT